MKAKSLLAMTFCLSFPLISGCGLTVLQKQQVSQFSIATESVSTITQTQFISTREKVIDLERRRLIMRKNAPPRNFDLDGGLSLIGISTQISTLKALDSYAKLLNKLASDDQSEALTDAANRFMTQYETAKKSDESDYSLDNAKSNSLIGVLNITNSWLVEKEKKNSIKKVVKAYSKEIGVLANLIRNDVTLTGYSLCREDNEVIESDIKEGVIDIYCTSAHAVKQLSTDVLTSQNYTFSERQFAYDSYFKSEASMQEIKESSRKNDKMIDAFLKANNELYKIIDSNKYKVEDVELYAKQAEELVNLTKFFIE
jgi:hypothetical protein